MPDAFDGSLPSCCFFLRASTHGVRTLFSVKARNTPSVERVAEVANWRRAGAHPEIVWLGFAREKNRSRGVRVAMLEYEYSRQTRVKRMCAMIEVNICFRRLGNNGITRHFELEARRGPTGKVRPRRRSDHQLFRFHLVPIPTLHAHWNNEHGDSSP